MGQLLSTFTIRTLERSKFQSRKGQADEVGEYSIDGVSGTRAKIQLDFFRPGGAKTRHLLPTGIAVDNVAGVQASCIDATNPCTFVRFEDVGLMEQSFPMISINCPKGFDGWKKLGKPGKLRWTWRKARAKLLGRYRRLQSFLRHARINHFMVVLLKDSPSTLLFASLAIRNPTERYL